MYVGADYYPEHWPRERWSVYAKWMKKAGFNAVRMAEFAWVFMEPEEGRFDFSWLDEALATLRKRGISAVLGTPTAVMPAWVAEKYPETLAMEAGGRRAVWGVRKNNCFSSGAYRLLSERITRAMALHFRSVPNVIGWQTDNEFGAPPCFCPTCRADFQDWLRRRYGGLDELNRAWGAHFWGHRVRAWSEIRIPPDQSTFNPGQCLDFQRFFTFQNVRFQRDQVRILREVCPKHFVTHNFMGFVPDLNYFDLAEDLDFVSWDNYPIQGEPGMLYDAAGAGDLMRGLKRRNYWVMEMNAGPAGWGAFGRNPRPGEMRLVALQQVAHGADGLIWFRWRTCTAGREQYWHGLLGHDGRPLRRYREAARTARDFKKLEKLLADTTVKADVAILYDYDSLWATRIQPSFQGNDYQAGLRRYQQALMRAGVNVDLVSTAAGLGGYRLVIAPQLYVLPDAIALKLDAYVRAGGVLLADLRTGVKDESGLCHERTLPGLLSKCLGIEIREYEAIPESTPIAGWLPAAGRALHAIQYADWVIPKTAEKLAGYSGWHLAPYAAVTRNAHGRGVGYYVGTVARESQFYDELIANVIKTARVRPALKPPPGVEVSVRSGRGRKLLFLMNESEQAKTLPVPAGKLEVLSGRKTLGKLTLPRFGVAVIQIR